jgi:hypothetical protein
MAGINYNMSNTRLLYRALLWVAGKEKELKKAFSSNIYTECHYYPEHKTYAIVNNSAETQSTVFYDIDGKSREVEIEASGILWIK